MIEVAAHAETLSGYQMTYAPRFLRHFTARFERNAGVPSSTLRTGFAD